MTAPHQKAVDIAEVGLEFFGLKLADLVGRDRTEPLVFFRQAIMAEIYRAGLSYPVTGKLFYRNHATVIHAVKVTRKRKKQKTALADQLKQFEAEVARQVKP